MAIFSKFKTKFKKTPKNKKLVGSCSCVFSTKFNGLAIHFRRQ
jgi:hypothetical protein